MYKDSSIFNEYIFLLKKCSSFYRLHCINLLEEQQRVDSSVRNLTKDSTQFNDQQKKLDLLNQLLHKSGCCSSIPNVCPDGNNTDEGLDGGHNGDLHHGEEGRRRRRSSQNNERQQYGEDEGGQDGEDEAHHGEYAGHNGETGSGSVPVGPGEEWYGGGGGLGTDGPLFTLSAPMAPSEADPDFKNNAEFLQLLMQLDEETRARIGHK